MEAILSQTAAAAFAAASLKARAAGTFGIIARASTKEIAEILSELAEEFGGDVTAASASLWSMDESERLEAFDMDEDDEKSFVAAKYGMAA